MDVNLVMDWHVFGLEVDPEHGGLELEMDCCLRLTADCVAEQFALAEATSSARAAADQEGYDLVLGPTEGSHAVHVVPMAVVETQDTETIVAQVTLRLTMYLTRVVLGSQRECVPFSLQELGPLRPAALAQNRSDFQGLGALSLVV